MTLAELWEQQRKNHFAYCNIDKYHAAGYKGQGINFLNLESDVHGNQVCKVYSEVAPESKVFKGVLTGVTNGTEITKFDITANGIKQDFETFIVNNNIKLINVSKEDGRVQVKEDFMKKYIIEKHGIILTNSAGNDGDYVSGSYRNVAIVVGTVDYKSGVPVRASYSGQGPEVDFVAFSHLFTGTSFSSVFLIGMIALLLSKNGDFNQEECYKILKSCCVDLGEPGDDNYFGWGIPVLPLTDRLEILDKLRGVEEMQFKDVEDTRWSKVAIDRCVAEGLLVGFEDGTFRPTETVTREQFAAILTRILDKIEGRQ